MRTCSVSWDCVAGTVTHDYELGNLGFNSLQGKEICYFSKT